MEISVSRPRWRTPVPVGLVVVGLAVAAGVAGQDPGPAASPAADTVPAAAFRADSLAADPAVDTVQPVEHPPLVVRAMRMPVAPDRLPYAVTIRRPATGVPVAGRTLATGLWAVPGLQVHGRYNDALGDRIVIRGFGARTQFGVRGVHVLVDGIPATMPDGQTTLSHLDRTLLDRAEVLRGPAAAVYGNAAGGAILLQTVAPPSVRFRQDVAATAGSDGLLRLRATAGGSGGGGGASGWIASVARETGDGFRPHSSTERYQLTARFETGLAGGFLRATAHATRYDAQNPGALTPEQYRQDPFQAQAYNVTQGTGEEGRHGQIGLAWERPVRAGRLEAVLYGLARSIDNPIPPSFIDLDRHAAGGRLSLRSANPPETVAWGFGVDAASQWDDRSNFENDAGARGPRTLDQDERVVNLAAHGRVLLPLADRVGLLAAARYDRVSFSADDHFHSDGDPDDSGRRTMHAVSPTAGLRVDLSSDVAVFANVGTAFETPTTTELVNRPEGAGGLNPGLEPQRTVSYEAGVRAALADRLRVEASAYHADVRDALVPYEVPSAPGRQYYRNAGRTVHEGFELLAEARFERVDATVAFSRVDARFGEYEVDGEPLAGNEVPGVRPWSVEARVVARPLSLLTLEADFRRAGAMAVDDANATRAPAHSLLSLRAGLLGWSVAGLDIALHGGVDNVLDAPYVASVVPNAFGDRFFEPGPGRALYVGLEMGAAVRDGARSP